MQQTELFSTQVLPIAGLSYTAAFLTRGQEDELLRHIGDLPLVPARYRQYTAHRRIVCYGGQYDFSTGELQPAGPIPGFLSELKARVAGWAKEPAHTLTHAMIAEYSTGTRLGWHRDVPEFELVIGVSLGGHGRMRFRPYPAERPQVVKPLSLPLEPRSVYMLQGAARWEWQHCIAPTQETRFSITFRSLRRPTP